MNEIHDRSIIARSHINKREEGKERKENLDQLGW